MNDLDRLDWNGQSGFKARKARKKEEKRADKTHRVASLCDEVWQNRKRSSLSDLLKAYLPDMMAVPCVRGRLHTRFSRVEVRTVVMVKLEAGTRAGAGRPIRGAVLMSAELSAGSDFASDAATTSKFGVYHDKWATLFDSLILASGSDKSITSKKT